MRLAGEVLVLGDAGVGLGLRIVHDGHRLVPLPVERLDARNRSER